MIRTCRDRRENMCERTGISDEHFVRRDVSSTGIKGVRETETCDRECVGNIRKIERKK